MIRKSSILIIMALLCAMGIQAQGFAGGLGTKEHPYEIANTTQLQSIKDVVKNGTMTYFVLVDDIDMSSVSNWEPWNQESPYRKGVVLDGQQHVISNFTCKNKSYSSFAGVLFGEIKNVNFQNAYVENTTGSHCGIIAGFIGTETNNYGVFGRIDNVNVQGLVKNNNKVVHAGGLAGVLRYGHVSNCKVDVQVVSATTGDFGNGGIVGYQYDWKNKTTNGLPFNEAAITPYCTKTKTLLDNNGWTTTTLADGCYWHNFEGYDYITKTNQIVNVLEVDMTMGKYKLDFAWKDQADILSNFVKERENQGIKVIGGVNGNYELDATYVRINDENKYTVSISPEHYRYWKHEGAVMGYDQGEVKIRLSDRENGTLAISNYNSSEAKNILSSAPSLIENFVNIGSTFVDEEYRNATTSQLEALDYENKNRHQGVRHPRTAVALTEDGDLLLITVDGRFENKAGGMNCDELTRFLIKYFNPQYALNLDGGGSTTMCVPGYGDAGSHVVNYPCDNKKFDHAGERTRECHLIIVEK